MNDHDELASAYLDDEATAEERARVEADPLLRARVDELRVARDAVASAAVEPVPLAVRDAAVRAAVRAAPVVDLAAVRLRRRLRLASIAAGALLLVGAVGLLVRSQRTDTTTKSAAGVAPTTTVPAALPNRVPSPGAAAAAQPYSLSMLGPFADRESLVAAVTTAVEPAESRADTAGAPSSATTAAPRQCTPTPPPRSTGEQLSAPALLEGNTVQLDVFTLDDGSRLLVVTKTPSCEELFSQPL